MRFFTCFLATMDCSANLVFFEHLLHARHHASDFLFCLILALILQCGYDSPHFPNGETEGWRGEEACPQSHSGLKSRTVQVMLVSVCLSLTHTYGLRVLDEDLGAPHLVLVWLHVDRPQQVLDPLTLVPTPVRPRLGGQNSIPGGGEQGRV